MWGLCWLKTKSTSIGILKTPRDKLKYLFVTKRITEAKGEKKIIPQLGRWGRTADIFGRAEIAYKSNIFRISMVFKESWYAKHLLASLGKKLSGVGKRNMMQFKSFIIRKKSYVKIQFIWNFSQNSLYLYNWGRPRVPFFCNKISPII